MEIFKAFFYGNLLNVIGFYNDLWILIALTTEIVNWKIFSLLKISIFQKKILKATRIIWLYFNVHI